MEDQNPGPNIEQDLEYGDSRKDDRLNRVVDKSSPSRYTEKERDRERYREDRDRERDREDRGRHNRLPTPRSNIELTRRGRPRYDFLDEDSGSFEDRNFLKEKLEEDKKSDDFKSTLTE